MYRLLVVVFLCIACMGGNVAYADEAQTRASLLELQQTLPGFKGRLDELIANGVDVSYPMVSYTVLENFIAHALEALDFGNLTLAESQEPQLFLMKLDLDEELNGTATFKTVPRWTGKSRPIIKGSSFIAPTTTPGRSCIEYRPVLFNGYGHFSQVKADIEKFPKYGINIIQIEIGPSNLFPAEGVTDTSKINDLVSALDRAEAAGIAVNLLISPHYFPGWMLKKYTELQKSRSGFLGYCLHAPVGQEFLKTFITTLITPIKNHSALHSVCLSNEPRNLEVPCGYATAEFREWLQKQHGTIGILNQHWGSSYANFNSITLPDPLSSNAQTPLTRWFDFVRWNQEFFTRWHKILADAVHAVDPNIPVHAKVQATTFGNTGEQKCGNDPYLYAGISEINGNDCANTTNFGTTDYANGWLGPCLYYDLQRSMKDAPVFNSENHLINNGDPKEVSAQHVREVLWQEAIHGQSATTIWVWQLAYDPKSDLYGNIMGRPACARAVGIVDLDLNRCAREITALQQTPDQVCILHSTSALVYDKELYDRCLFRTYMALNFTGAKISLISERQLEEGKLPKTSVLCIPNSRHLTDKAYKNLKKYTGHIVFVGTECLLYNEYDKARNMDLSADFVMAFVRTSTWEEDIYNAVLPKLVDWGVLPKVAVVDSNGNRVWGIDYKEAETADGTLVNLCNYLNKSLNVKLSRNGSSIRSIDVLTGDSVNGEFILQPLDFRLLRVVN